MSITPVCRKGSTEPTAYSVEIVKGKSISIFEDGKLCNTFALFDCAEYDSYNLSYYGRIVSISDKCVVIEERFGSKPRKHFLDLYKFCWRNHAFEVNKASAENAVTSQYI